VLALPLVFALPVVAGVVVSLVRLVGSAHPAAAWSNVTNGSTAALFVGSDVYQDPARGFTGGIFPPLLPFAGSALDHLKFWSGWVILLTVLASVAMAATLGVIAYAPRGPSRLDRLAAAAGALAVAGLTWWLSSSLTTNFLLDGRADQPAWALALLGLLLVPAAARESNLAWAGALVLITAGVWTKQTSLTAVLAACVWLPAACLLRVARWKRAGALMAALIVLNAVVFLIGDALTRGWLRYFLIDIPRNQAITATRAAVLDEFVRRMVLPGAIVGAVVLIAGIVALLRWREIGHRIGWRRLVAGARRGEGAGRDVALATLALLFVALAAAGALYARRKQGTTDNQYIGVVWGLGALGALAYRHAATRRGGAAGFALLSLLLIALTQADGLKQRLLERGVYVPELSHAAQWSEVDPALRRFVRTHTVYAGLIPDINVWAGVDQDPARRRTVYPGYIDTTDLLAAGGQPRYLARALLDRRFDAVMPFPDDAGYASAYGTREEGYIWKLNKIIDARYAPSPDVPAGFLTRRAGPEQARWMRTCFGPFRFPGGSLEIGRGGGLWCRLDPRSDRITLRDTPAPVSEIRTRDPIDQLGGALAIEVASDHGTFDVHVRLPDHRELSVTGERRGDRIVISQFGPRGQLGQVVLRRTPHQLVSLRFSRGPLAAPALAPGSGGREVTVRFGDVRGGTVRFAAARGSDVTFDVSSLELDDSAAHR